MSKRQFNPNHRPNPYKRAIAMAIELERTHDVLARIVGHSIPLPGRIVPEGSRASTRRERMNLGRPLTLEAMNDLSDERLSAIEHVAGLVGNDMDVGFVADMLEEAKDRTASEARFPYAPKGPSRHVDPDDRLSAGELLRKDIERAADAPPPPIATVEPAPAPEEHVDSRSIAIDLMTDGLLSHYGVDRDALHADLTRHRGDFTRRNMQKKLVSPAVGSNTSEALVSLGKDFPYAVFRLQGLSLSVEQLEMPVDEGGDPYFAWSYRTGTGADSANGMPRLERPDAMPGFDVFDFPQRALRDITGDIRFHDALVIHSVDRLGIMYGSPSTVIRLRNGYAHLDPPGTDPASRIKVRRASDVRRPDQARVAHHRDYEHARAITRMLAQRGHPQRTKFSFPEGSGINLMISDPGTENLAHTFLIKRDTIDDGEAAIAARIDEIVSRLGKWQARRKANLLPPVGVRAQTVPAPLAKPVAGAAEAQVPEPQAATMTDDADDTKDNSAVENEEATMDEAGDAAAVVQEDAVPEAETRPVPPTPDEMIAAFGEAMSSSWEGCERIDALLSDAIAGGTLDPEQVELHAQERLVAVKRMKVAPGMVYVLEKFDRLMGRVTHAVGTIEVDRQLPPALVEALRDGSVRRLVPKLPAFSASQVRKVSVRDGATLVTVRVPLEPRPQSMLDAA